MEPGDGGIGEEDEQDRREGHRQVQSPRHGRSWGAALLGQRRTVLPADEHVKGEGEAGRESRRAASEVRPGERDAGEVSPLVDEDHGAHGKHDGHLRNYGTAHRGGGQLDATNGQSEGADGEEDGQRFPRRMPSRVVGEGQGDHPAGHGEDAGDGDRIADNDEQCSGHPRSRPERGLHVGDEASCRWLRPRELCDGEGQEHDGHTGGHDREGRGDAGRDRDDPEGEVEVDFRPDVGDRRGGDIRGAELPAFQLGSVCVHRVRWGPADLWLGRSTLQLSSVIVTRHLLHPGVRFRLTRPTLRKRTRCLTDRGRFRPTPGTLPHGHCPVGWGRPKEPLRPARIGLLRG